MERLRYVARSGGGDPATLVADTVEAIRSLAPGPGELVSVCRNLVDRAVTCGPLWWLCAHLLSQPDVLAVAWDLADEIAEDPTPDRLATAIPEDVTVLTVGYPALAARALARRGDLSVVAVDAGHAASSLVRLLDRSDVSSELVPAEAILLAARHADLVLLETDACASSGAVGAVGSGLAAVAARSCGTPVWLVAGRGRRLPAPFVDAIVLRTTCADEPWSGEFEVVPTDVVSWVAGPDAVIPAGALGFAAECPLVPELIPPEAATKPI
jgi:hypothetical protein